MTLNSNLRDVKRYPNLGTILMVEEFLEENRDISLRVSQIKENLPRKVMHQTLLVILEYLWLSGKIIYGPKGIQWIYSNPLELKSLKQKSVEL